MGELDAEVENMLAPLSGLERCVIQARFFDAEAPRALEEVAALLELSSEEIRRIEGGAMSRMSAPSRGTRPSSPTDPWSSFRGRRT